MNVRSGGGLHRAFLQPCLGQLICSFIAFNTKVAGHKANVELIVVVGCEPVVEQVVDP